MNLLGRSESFLTNNKGNNAFWEIGYFLRGIFLCTLVWFSVFLTADLGTLTSDNARVAYRSFPITLWVFETSSSIVHLGLRVFLFLFIELLVQYTDTEILGY